MKFSDVSAYILVFLLVCFFLFVVFGFLVDIFWHCSFDHFFVAEDGFYCDECGDLIRPLPTVCDQCGVEFKRSHEFCTYCGGVLNGE